MKTPVLMGYLMLMSGHNIIVKMTAPFIVINLQLIIPERVEKVKAPEP
jgi:hypothetical protein